MLKRSVPFAVLLLGIAYLTPLAAQLPPPPPGKPPLPLPPGKPPEGLMLLQKLVGAKAAEVNQAIRGVSAYPKQTRTAILDIAKATEKHPTLIDDLVKLRSAAPVAADKYLTGNKLEPEVQNAAALVLVQAPDALEQMQARPDLVKVVGIAWSTPPGRELITNVLDAAGTQQEKARSNSADRWAARLKADPKLLAQYTQLLEDYTQRTAGTEGKTDDTWKSLNYGIYKGNDGYVVTDVPSSEIISYALALGTQYQTVANALIQQYLNGTNTDDYNSAVGGWYSTYGSSVPQSTQSSNSDYYALLQELSALAAAAYNNYASNDSGYGSDGGYSNGYGDSYGSGDGSGNSGSGNSGSGSGNSDSGNGNTINNLIGNNVGKYPKIADWKAKNPAPKLDPSKDLARLKEGPLGKSPFDMGKGPSAAPFSDHLKGIGPDQRAKPMSPGGQNPFQLAGRKPAPNVGGGMKPGGQLMRGSPPMGQQLSRAGGQMRGAWNPPHGGGRPSGGRPGGGPGPKK